ncbi:flagellar protein FlaG [Halomonas sp. McH1-25]|uniref:flagellar protein FlaG n=1 Tax=unclassified Halomonas TaxID=2609666 RepID=UPI001EF470AD|nr:MULTISPECIES: flagellar protein FlaG [unclassified Halomonas]MCG7598640.1 flagellar protein FlaG [Halomonas sp. McH1-25]MCP1343623.1 flagellar protein FlaG [Halomonas sp. FL8]MCP1363310.1 flagellar protein FlaG [Halomonas sp. BBD45]MCP1366127.1 flagellar protein FlaG [Halomonas sp. BBD48]
MTSPLTDASSASATPSLDQGLTPHQRLESVLSHLPRPAGSLLVEAYGNSDVAPGVRYRELLEPVQRINEVMRSYGVEFQLQEFAQGQRVVTRIVDRDSGELIRQIPSEEVLRIAESLEQMQGKLIHLQA